MFANKQGTGDAAKIVGKTLGVAKKAKIIMVSVVNVDGQEHPEAYLDGMARVYDEVRDKRHNAPTVVAMPFNFRLRGFPWQDAAYEESLFGATATLANQLISLDVICVAAAGNRGEVSRI